MLWFQELRIFFAATPAPVMRWGLGENEGGCHEEPVIDRSNRCVAPCGGSGLRIDLPIPDAVAGIFIDLIEADFLSLAARGK
jgi:hypothetical protein